MYVACSGLGYQHHTYIFQDPQTFILQFLGKWKKTRKEENQQELARSHERMGRKLETMNTKHGRMKQDQQQVARNHEKMVEQLESLPKVIVEWNDANDNLQETMRK